MRAWAGRVGLCIGLAAVFLSASCTDLQLRKYRNDELLRDHHYTLGEKYVAVEGSRICYQEMGSGSETVLILPGLCTSIDFWQLTIPELAKHFRVVAVDPPGFGKSDKPEASYELKWIAERIVAFMDAKGITRAHLMGASLGGQFALMLAMDHPQRVGKLVLMGSCGSWPPPGPIIDAGIRLFWNDAVATDHMRRNWPKIFRDITGSDGPIVRGLLEYQMALRASGKEYAAEGRASSRALRSIFYTNLRPRLSEVRQPVLLVWGEKDKIHLLSEACYFRGHLPDARLVILPNEKHQVILEQPDVFNRLAMAFLTGQPLPNVPQLEPSQACGRIRVR